MHRRRAQANNVLAISLLAVAAFTVAFNSRGPLFVSRPQLVHDATPALPVLSSVGLGMTALPQLTWAMDGYEGFNKMSMAVKEEKVTGSAGDGPLAFGIVGLSAVLFVLVVIIGAGSRAKENE
mmetsp:Transcript_22041/g.51442  ORF Transcript_22041/g.51442 Transcript_22041/m.51442 type:complete len:123 (-) Transcript_22041:61-429(-)